LKQITYKEIINKCHSSKKDTYKWYYYHRFLSLPLTKLFYGLNIKADTISISMIVLSIVGFFLMIFKNNILFGIGYFFMFLAFLFDKIDGDLARLYGVANIKGTVYDFVYHRFSLFLFYLGIGIHFSYENQYIVILAALNGFIANYIEEMQLLPHRVFSHKYLLKDEKLPNLNQNIYLTENKFFKILKLFRMQLLLFYYFIIAFIIKHLLDCSMTIFMLIAFIGLFIYSIYQVYFMMKYQFNNEIYNLKKELEKK